MPCEKCIYWEYIGNVKDVVNYKESHPELSEKAFENFKDDENLTIIYGRCSKLESCCIAPSTKTCNSFTLKSKQ